MRRERSPSNRTIVQKENKGENRLKLESFFFFLLYKDRVLLLYSLIKSRALSLLVALTIAQLLLIMIGDSNLHLFSVGKKSK